MIVHVGFLLLNNGLIEMFLVIFFFALNYDHFVQGSSLFKPIVHAEFSKINLNKDKDFFFK